MVKKKFGYFLKKLKDRHESMKPEDFPPILKRERDEKEKKLQEEEGKTANAILSKKRKEVLRINNQEVEKAPKLKLEMDTSKAKEANRRVPKFKVTKKNSNALTDLRETYKDQED